MTDPRKALKRIRKRANKAALMIDIGPTSDKEWELCATAALLEVPALLDALEKVLELHSPLAGRPSWDGDIRCSGCYDSYYDVYEPYPCELVEAITTALEKIA